MKLDKKTINGVEYVELYSSCPLCYSQGVETERNFATHKNCGGRLYIGDNAHLLCDQCDTNKHVKFWRTHCGHCGGGEGQLTYSDDSSGLPTCQSIVFAGQIVSETGVLWLQRYLSQLGEF